MSDTHRRGLIALNIVLLALVAVVTFAPLSSAQPATNRARGEYTVVGGQIVGGTPSVIYIFDSNNDEMVALRWNNSRSQLEPIGFRDLNEDGMTTNQGGPR